VGGNVLRIQGVALQLGGRGASGAENEADTRDDSRRESAKGEEAVSHEALSTMWVAMGLSIGLSIGLILGYMLGRHTASEDFYTKCQGGQVYLDDYSGGVLEVVGCAEIARRMR
jgi:hypothetical protein